MKTNTTNTFIVRQYSQHGYSFTEICIRQCYVESLEEQAEGCVDNKTGYQSLEIAKQQEARFRGLLAAGYEATYSPVTYGLEVTLRYQHYKGEGGGYCDPHYDTLGPNFNGIEKGMKFLRKLGTTIEKMRSANSGSDFRKVSSHTFENPERVIEALRKLKVVETTYNRNLNGCVRVDVVSASEAA